MVDKARKRDVHYSKGMKQSHCGICIHYAARRCAKVQGIIDPDYWCDIFKSR